MARPSYPTVEPHRVKLRQLLHELAGADGWREGRCPTCRRWNEPRLAEGTAPEVRPIPDDGAHVLVGPTERLR